MYKKWNILTHLFPLHPFCNPWKDQKTLRFWCFRRVQKRCIGSKWVESGKWLFLTKFLNCASISYYFVAEINFNWLKLPFWKSTKYKAKQSRIRFNCYKPSLLNSSTPSLRKTVNLPFSNFRSLHFYLTKMGYLLQWQFTKKNLNWKAQFIKVTKIIHQYGENGEILREILCYCISQFLLVFRYPKFIRLKSFPNFA